ncbi:FAD-dependent oxidoreductase [Planosporangium sp. 12N6]|uniref:FAD-dependent oxidoreductase n=1 Tax=Planosporangium spinosum TaxID=3402278 RepID=UPI003CEA6C0A
MGIGLRRWMVVRPQRHRPWTAPRPATVVVVGGGIAGVSAALVLAERGLRVTLLERAPWLGGRLAAWPHRLRDGSTHLVDHGFHGFFRQYYTWRAILRRIDPELGFLRPLGRYPVLSRTWAEEDVADLPRLPLVNLCALIARSPSLGLDDLRRMDGKAALPLLTYERRRTYREYDHIPATRFLDSLQVPERARAMLFDVFAHSFFNREETMSAAEMIMMFHFYFLGNPEGLDIDAPTEDHATAIWQPLAARLDALGADVRTASPVDRIEPGHDGWRVTLRGGEAVTGRYAILAADPPAVRALGAASTGLTRTAPHLAAQLDQLGVAAPYVVSRLWTDRDCQPHRAAFNAVTREATLDSVTAYHRVERQAGRWTVRGSGAVLELHAYACDDHLDASTAAARMRAELAALWPETAAMGVVDQHTRREANAPAFGVGSDHTRPGVVTDAPGLFLAGDWVRLPFPTALMERAAASGVLAADQVLADAGAALEPIRCVRPRGILARPPEPAPSPA